MQSVPIIAILIRLIQFNLIKYVGDKKAGPWFSLGTMVCLQLPGICVTNDHGYVPFVVITIRFCPYSCFVTGFVTTVTRHVHMWSRNCFPFLSTWVRSRCLLVLVVFVLFILFISIFIFLCNVLYIVVCPFPFGHCIVCPSIYEFWLSLFGLFLVIVESVNVYHKVKGNRSMFITTLGYLFLSIYHL